MGHSLVETTCACGTLIIHSEVFNCSVRSNGYTLDILSANIDNSFYLGICNVYTHCVTGNFRHIFVCKGYTVSSVACFT